MRPKQYSCPKGCKLEPRKKELIEKADHTFTYGYDDFTYCPYCGSLMPYSLEKVKNFFDLFNIHPSLKRAVDLIYKSEFEAAAREAFVVVETMLREKSNLDLHGFDLATKALKFECDKKTGEVINKPLIAINALNTDSNFPHPKCTKTPVSAREVSEKIVKQHLIEHENALEGAK